MLTVGLLAVVVYLYTVVAFNFFRKFYNKSEDEDAPDMKCDDMMTVPQLAFDIDLVQKGNVGKVTKTNVQTWAGAVILHWKEFLRLLFWIGDEQVLMALAGV